MLDRWTLDFGVPLGALGAKQDPSMASGFLWPYSRISSYSSRANLFLAAMLGSHGINGHQGYQQDFSTPAWDHILKTPHLMKQNKNSDQYWCCCFICFHSVDQAAIIDPRSPSPSICWSTEIPGVKQVALHLRQTLGTPTSTLHTFIMICRISMFTKRHKIRCVPPFQNKSKYI
jgi:hypothetical protein